MLLMTRDVESSVIFPLLEYAICLEIQLFRRKLTIRCFLGLW